MMLSERLERVCKWNCERIQEGASIRVSMRVKYSIECIQYLTIHGTINAPVTAILNAAHATGISKSESETHIHFYMITSLNNFFCVFFSHSLYINSMDTFVVCWFFFRLHTFISIGSLIFSLKRMNTKFVFGKRKKRIYCSVVQMKWKQRQKIYMYSKMVSQSFATQAIWIAK